MKSIIPFLLGTIPTGVLCADILRTNGFSTCFDGKDIKVERVDIQYDRTTKLLTFDVAGSSARTQNVTASLEVSAYGQEVYQKNFDPCSRDSFVEQLCPGEEYFIKYIAFGPKV